MPGFAPCASIRPTDLAQHGIHAALIDPGPGWLIIGASGLNKAEDIVSLIRKAFGSLPVVSPVTAQAPAFAKTGAVVRCKGKDLGSEEVRNPLDTGMQVTQLALTWQERIRFSLDAGLAIRRLKYLEGVMEAAADIDAEDAAQRFDADFSIMAAELAGLLDDLIAAFGGEKP